MLEYLKRIVLQQAEEKGFGMRPEDIVFSEKIALIHSEISEAYKAFLEGNLDKEGGFYEELGDVLQRTLHLGGIFGVEFSSPADLSEISSASIQGKIAKLHQITSSAWEYYRYNNMEGFRGALTMLAALIVQLSHDYGFSLEKVVEQKIERNKSRDWKKRGLKEKFT